MTIYFDWKNNKIRELKDRMFNKLTPMEYYISQNKGTERPFTGDYWDNQKVGIYACKVCTQRIFSSTHKYNAKIGHATFWNFLPFTLNFYDDHLQFPKPTQAIYLLDSSQPNKRLACSNVNEIYLFSVIVILDIYLMMDRHHFLKDLMLIHQLYYFWI